MASNPTSPSPGARVLTLIAVVAIVTLAGCGGGSSPTESSTVVADTATTTVEATQTTATETTSESTTAETTAVPEWKTLTLSDLPSDDRRLLGDAIENGTRMVYRANLTGDLSPDHDGWFLRYQGTLYRISIGNRGYLGEYHLENVTRVNESAVGNETHVVAYDNASDDARTLFDRVRAGNESDGMLSDEFPDAFHEHRYVRYEGEYYALEIAVADWVVYELTVDEVRNG